MRYIFVTLLISVLLWGCSNNKPKEEVSPLAQAEEAYAKGQYDKAASLMMPLAKSGNAQAQYTIGYMYYYGQGLPRDRTQGHFWMQAAAKQGNKSALKALELLNQESRKGAQVNENSTTTNVAPADTTTTTTTTTTPASPELPPAE